MDKRGLFHWFGVGYKHIFLSPFCQIRCCHTSSRSLGIRSFRMSANVATDFKHHDEDRSQLQTRSLTSPANPVEHKSPQATRLSYPGNIHDTSENIRVALVGRENQRYVDGFRLVVGAVPYRIRLIEVDRTSAGRSNDGTSGLTHSSSSSSSLEISRPVKRVHVDLLLVASTKGDEWIFPKGGWESFETFEEGVHREVEEEAGVLTTLESLIGSVRSLRPDPSGAPSITMCTTARVTRVLKHYADAHTRARRWFSLEEAATVLQRPVHVAMLRGAVTASSSILHQLLVQESFEYLAYECGDALRAMAFPPSLVEVMKGASDTCVGHESYDQSPADSSSSAAPSTTMAPPVAHLGTPYSSLSAHLLSAREHERFVDCDAVDATSAPDSATSTPDHANATARLHNLLLSFVKSMNELNDKTAHTKRADLAQSMSQIIGEAALACRLERFEEPWKALMLNKKDPITMDALSSAYVDRMASISAAASEQEPVSVGLPAS